MNLFLQVLIMTYRQRHQRSVQCGEAALTLGCVLQRYFLINGRGEEKKAQT